MDNKKRGYNAVKHYKQQKGDIGMHCKHISGHFARWFAAQQIVQMIRCQMSSYSSYGRHGVVRKET